MKEYLLHLIKYNREANKKVTEILADLSEETRLSDKKSHFVNLHGILDHIAGGALFLQKTIKASCPELGGLTHKYMDYQLEHGKVGFPNFTELKSVIEILDNAMVDMIQQLSDEDFNQTVTFRIPQASLEYSLSMFITMYMNHGTHHRGQISQILDEMKIDNNYSSIAPKYE